MNDVREITLTSPQVIAAVRDLDHEELHPRTLAAWATRGPVEPSWWPRKRGRYNARRYTLIDLARVRLVVRLRAAGVSMPRVRTILGRVDGELRDVLKPRTKAELHVDGFSAVVVRPGRAAVELPDGQLRLPLADVVHGNADAARKAARIA